MLSAVSVLAHNTATASANKIHDDEVARRYGFRGGLVPGVDVYAYLTRPAVAAWGVEWLARGWIDARFVQPVYDGERVDVVPVGDDGLEVRNGDGVVCATATVRLPDTDPPPVDTWPVVEPHAGPLPPASPATLVPGTALALDPHRFLAAKAGEYLDAVRDDLPLYKDDALAHPGWLLRDANYVLSRNVALGPWIHVGSVVQHHRPVHDGDEVVTRAVVTAEWERKGHRFVTLDVGVLAGGEVAARVEHTAIYAPRSS